MKKNKLSIRGLRKDIFIVENNIIYNIMIMKILTIKRLLHEFIKS